MRAWLLDAPGSQLRLGHLPDPEPGPGQWLVRVRFCGLNPVDWKLAASGHPDWVWPQVLGLDVVGEVVGTGVDAPPPPAGLIAAHLNLAQRGGLAEYVTLTPGVTAALPAGLDPWTAATLPCPGLTAWQAVGRIADILGRAGHSRRALVLGGGGPVGSLAVQLLVQQGAQVAATCSATDRARVHDLGAIWTADYHNPQALPELVTAAGGPFACVVNTATPQAAEDALPLVEFTGALASITGRPHASEVPEFTLAPTLVEVALGAIHSHGTHDQQAAFGDALHRLLNVVDQGRLTAPQATVVPMTDVADTLTKMSHSTGSKYVVEVIAGENEF